MTQKNWGPLFSLEFGPCFEGLGPFKNKVKVTRALGTPFFFLGGVSSLMAKMYGKCVGFPPKKGA